MTPSIHAETDSKRDDREKILALSIIALAILLLPLLILGISLSVFFAVISLIDFFNTQSLMTGLKALALIACSGGLSLPTRYLIKWLRS